MVAECVVIFGILLSMIIIFLRTNKEHAIKIVPLLILPGANIIGYAFSEGLSRLVPTDRFMLYTMINVASVIVSGLFIGMFSAKFKTKYTKTTYALMCIAFNIILASILIANAYGKMVQR